MEQFDVFTESQFPCFFNFKFGSWVCHIGLFLLEHLFQHMITELTFMKLGEFLFPFFFCLLSQSLGSFSFSRIILSNLLIVVLMVVELEKVYWSIMILLRNQFSHILLFVFQNHFLNVSVLNFLIQGFLILVHFQPFLKIFSPLLGLLSFILFDFSLDVVGLN